MPHVTDTASNSAPPLLEVTDLCFTHVGQTRPTVKGVHLTLQPGELVVLAGATGSGKSTLLSCLTGIAPEHTGGKLSGRVLYRGEEITNWSIRQRSRAMGVMLQNVETQLFTDQVWDEVVFGLENWNLPPGEIQSLAQAAMAEFDLTAQQSWRINQLSAGQKQRLLLACLLTRRQEILLLDEPFAYLDMAGVNLLLELLKQRVRQGQAVLLIEHRLELLRSVCDRAYRIQDGQLSPWMISEHPESLSALSEVGETDANTVKLNTPLNPPTLQEGMPTKGGDKMPQLSPPFVGGVGGSPKNLETYSSNISTNTPNPTPTDTSQVKSEPILQTQNISWGGYPPFPDLQIHPQEVVLLKGDNGCGKTTLLRLLSGLLKPATGRLDILTRNVTRWSVVKIAKFVGFVLQNPNHQLFAESVEFEVRQPTVFPGQAEALLEQMNLKHCADKHPHALSQGQKRRLALAAVLARQPRICLLDEIMVGQDPTSLSLMLKALKLFTDEGGTLIFTSHDPGVAEVLKPRVVSIR